MNKIYMTVILITCTMLGFFYFLYQESWIIITSPFEPQETINPSFKKNLDYKPVTLYYLYQQSIKTETTEILYSENTADTIKNLINHWLLFLEDEQITSKETQVLSVALSQSKQEAFICLNQPPFNPMWNTFQKLMWVESMLKTIRNNNIPITTIKILVHHQPLQDDHLNFDISWPISGFTHQL